MKIFYIGQSLLLFVAGVFLLIKFFGHLQDVPSEAYEDTWRIMNWVYGFSALIVNGLSLFLTLRLVRKFKTNG